jgi:anti-anti-sigma factor
MEINESKANEVTVLALSGRLDTLNYGVLEKKLQSLFDAGQTRIVLDCKDLDYISSSGLRVLLMYLKKANAVSGKISLSQLTRNIREIFDISGFTSIFDIYDNTDEAVRNT